MEHPSLLPLRQVLSLQYQQCLPLRASSFVWPTSEALVHMLPVLEADLLGTTFQRGETSLMRPCPPRQYSKSFFKQLMARIQQGIDQAQHQGLPGSEDLEIPETILEWYTELVTAPNIEPLSHMTDDPLALTQPRLPARCNKALHACEGNGTGASTYFARYLYPLTSLVEQITPPQSEDAGLFYGWGGITIPEESAFVSEGTTGLQTWEASLRLGAHLLAHQTSLLPRGSRVLELGAGAGFLASLCTQVLKSAGGGRVVATDVAPNVLTRLAEARRINSYTPAEMEVDAFDFFDALPPSSTNLSTQTDKHSEESLGPHILSKILEPPDEGLQLLQALKPTLILAADVVFDPAILPALVHTLHAALQISIDASGSNTPSPRALVASTQRNEATYTRFLDHLTDAGLAYEPVTLSPYPALSLPTRWIEGHANNNDTTFEYTCFPSAHVPECDGRVELLDISLGPR